MYAAELRSRIAHDIAAHYAGQATKYAHHFGLRIVAADDEQSTMEIGSDLPHSYEDFNERDIAREDMEELPGTCVVGVTRCPECTDPDDPDEEVYDYIDRALKRIEYYIELRGEGCKMLLVAGMDSDYGNDEGEWIVQGAEIAARYEIA